MLPGETSISSLQSLGGFLEYFIACSQLDLVLINLTTASFYFIYPLRAKIERLLKIKTLQQFFCNKGSDLAWKLESLLNNMFCFGTHTVIITGYYITIK